MEPHELKSVALFSSLTPDQLRFVAQQTDTIDVPAGKQLATEGRFAYEFFVIEDGTAEVTREGAPIAALGPGDFFGEIGLLEADRRTASVVATSPMRLLVLTGGAFKWIERQMPHVAAQVREQIAQRLEADRSRVGSQTEG
jgi:CRP/FNR family transcriptional regulator, cyclic AMP receptor protein